MAIGYDGKAYTGSGRIMAPKDKPDRFDRSELDLLHTIERHSLIPAIDGAFFLGIRRNGKLILFESDTTEPFCSIGSFPHWESPPIATDAYWKKKEESLGPACSDRERAYKGPMMLDKRVIFSPVRGFVLFIPHSNDKIIHRKFDFKTVLARAGRDYLIVGSAPPRSAIAGKEWKYQIKPIASDGPVRYRLVLAPERMSLSRDGLLTWKIPARISGTGDVDVEITDRKGKSTRHRFTIAFK
jgi:hypothetical protein